MQGQKGVGNSGSGMCFLGFPGGRGGPRMSTLGEKVQSDVAFFEVYEVGGLDYVAEWCWVRF